MYWKTKPEISTSVERTRKAHKITQADLARRVGVTRQTIIAIEKGNYVPSVALALKLSEALGTKVEHLFRLEEPIC